MLRALLSPLVCPRYASVRLPLWLVSVVDGLAPERRIPHPPCRAAHMIAGIGDRCQR